MRDLTEEEMAVLMLTRDLVSAFTALPELHVDDLPEFVKAIHSIQNIIMSRPAMTAFNEQLEKESTNDE